MLMSCVFFLFFLCLFEVSTSYHSRVTVYQSWLIIDEAMSNIAVVLEIQFLDGSLEDQLRQLEVQECFEYDSDGTFAISVMQN